MKRLFKILTIFLLLYSPSLSFADPRSGPIGGSGGSGGAGTVTTANVTAAGALMDSEVTSISGVKTLTVPDNTTISAFGASLIDDANATLAQQNLSLEPGVDVQAYNANTMFGPGTSDDGGLVVFDGTDGVTTKQATGVVETKSFKAAGSATASGYFVMHEDQSYGTDWISMKAPADITTSYYWYPPLAQCANGEVWVNDGAGQMECGSATGDVLADDNETITGNWTFTGTLTIPRIKIETNLFTGDDNVTAAQCTGATNYVSNNATLSLPSVFDGASCSFLAVGSVTIIIDPDVADKIWLDGVAGADGAYITNTGTAGDIAVGTYYSGDGWYFSTNGWTSE